MARFENRLAHEKSPYLLQHKNNPVDWYPWGEEAFKKAREESKLIFLSVGYSTCHWCHVMAHESFENEETAKLMNELFVNVKVDREERPDIDKIYMTFIQASQGGGGWPMSVWLTPSLHPIIGGTYFPPRDNYGRKGFPSVLREIAKLWRTKKETLEEQGSEIIKLLQNSVKESENSQESSDVLTPRTLSHCYEQISSSFDPIEGGFGRAPKFPRPVVLQLLSHIAAKTPTGPREERAKMMILKTLRKMGDGGMCDHLGGGFHRYSVDGQWHVPHFEKMLYDQSQLVFGYLDGYLLSEKDPFYSGKVHDILSYVLRVLTSPEGGFYSAEDADSLKAHGSPDHAEGAFYVWSKEEIDELLGDDAPVFNTFYGVKVNGNAPPGTDPHGEFSGKNILIVRKTVDEIAAEMNLSESQIQETLRRSKEKLFAVREKRPHPHLDDKVITAWNGLMISAFAKAGGVLGEEKYIQAAENSAKFIQENLFDANSKKLIRNYRQGPSAISAFADDYAMLIQGLLDLYEVSGKLSWLQWAVQLQQKQIDLFWDGESGGFFGVEEGGSSLVLRLKEDYDGAEPSYNSISTLNLARLSLLSNHPQWMEYSKKTLIASRGPLTSTPVAVPYMCVALDFVLSTPKQMIIVGEKDSQDTQEILREIFSFNIPNRIIILLDEETRLYYEEFIPAVRDMKKINGKATLFLCENFTCQLPVTSTEEVRRVLQSK